MWELKLGAAPGPGEFVEKKGFVLPCDVSLERVFLVRKFIYFYSKPFEQEVLSIIKWWLPQSQEEEVHHGEQALGRVLHALTALTGKQAEQHSRTVRGTSHSHNNSLCSSEDAWDSHNFNNE